MDIFSERRKGIAVRNIRIQQFLFYGKSSQFKTIQFSPYSFTEPMTEASGIWA